MSTKYKATMPDNAYFVTITTVGWIDVFTRLRQKYVLINSLRYCQKYKGLFIYAYCIMPSHLHMLCSAANGEILAPIIRDFKKHTSKKLLKLLKYIQKVEENGCWIIFKKHALI